MPTLAHRLAEYAVGLEFGRLPEAVVHEVKRRTIDSIGCALGAMDAEPCMIARRVAESFSVRRGATLIGTATRAPQDWATFANGCLVRTQAITSLPRSRWLKRKPRPGAS